MGVLEYCINNIQSGTLPTGVLNPPFQWKENEISNLDISFNVRLGLFLSKSGLTDCVARGTGEPKQTQPHITLIRAPACVWGFVKSPQKTFYFGVCTWNSAALRSDQPCRDPSQNSGPSICFHSFFFCQNLLRLYWNQNSCHQEKLKTLINKMSRRWQWRETRPKRERSLLSSTPGWNVQHVQELLCLDVNIWLPKQGKMFLLLPANQRVYWPL